jgi:hypothetical protein
MRRNLNREKISILEDYRRRNTEDYDDEDEDNEIDEQDADKEISEKDVENRVFYDGPRTALSEAERQYELAWEWKWKIERRLHDLVREERDDLDHLARLEARERYKHRSKLETQPTNGSQETETTRNGKNRQHKKQVTERKLT